MFRHHPPAGHCGACHDHDDLDRKLDRILYNLGDIMTNQEHIESDVTAIGTSIATAVAELKAQIAAGATPEQLDFTSLDALAASTAAEAAADAPVVPPTV